MLAVAKAGALLGVALRASRYVARRVRLVTVPAGLVARRRCSGRLSGVAARALRSLTAGVCEVWQRLQGWCFTAVAGTSLWHEVQALAPPWGEPWLLWHCRQSPLCTPVVFVLMAATAGAAATRRKRVGLVARAAAFVRLPPA